MWHSRVFMHGSWVHHIFHRGQVWLFDSLLLGYCFLTVNSLKLFSSGTDCRLWYAPSKSRTQSFSYRLIWVVVIREMPFWLRSTDDTTYHALIAISFCSEATLTHHLGCLYPYPFHIHTVLPRSLTLDSNELSFLHWLGFFFNLSSHSAWNLNFYCDLCQYSHFHPYSQNRFHHCNFYPI